MGELGENDHEEDEEVNRDDLGNGSEYFRDLAYD